MNTFIFKSVYFLFLKVLSYWNLNEVVDYKVEFDYYT